MADYAASGITDTVLRWKPSCAGIAMVKTRRGACQFCLPILDTLTSPTPIGT